MKEDKKALVQGLNECFLNQWPTGGFDALSNDLVAHPYSVLYSGNRGQNKYRVWSLDVSSNDDSNKRNGRFQTYSFQ